MPLIDLSYFVGELNIPNTDRPEVQQRLNLFIAKYEKELLLDLFGYELHRDFVAGIALAEPDAKWINLRDGFEYTGLNQLLTKWNGLRQADIKKSIIANYVYFHWMRDQATQTVGIGETVTKAENSTVVSPRFKMIRAWNDMAEEILNLRLFLNESGIVYSGWTTALSKNILRNYRSTNEHGI